jgi:hypothetical protein
VCPVSWASPNRKVVIPDRALDEREMISAGDIGSMSTTGSNELPDEQARVITMLKAVIKPVHNGVCLRVRAVTHETTCGAPQLAVEVQHLGAAKITYVNQMGGSWRCIDRVHDDASGRNSTASGVYQANFGSPGIYI